MGPGTPRSWSEGPVCETYKEMAPHTGHSSQLLDAALQTYGHD